MSPPVRPNWLRRASRAALALALPALTLLSCETELLPGDPCDYDPPLPECDPNLAAALNPGLVELGEGEEADVDVSITRGSSITGAVSLEVDDLPDGITAAFSPNPVPSNENSSTLTVANVGAEAGRHHIPITLEIVGREGISVALGLQIEVPAEESCDPWTEVESHRRPYRDVYFQTLPTTGYLTTGGATPTILRSTDAGRTWASMPSLPPLRAEGYYDQVHFGDDVYQNVGFVSTLAPGGVPELYRTLDGGATWQRIPFADEAILDILFMNDSQAFIVGTDLWRSEDGGATWMRVPSPPIGDLQEIAWATLSQLALAGNGGLAYSLDEGRTWQLAGAPTDQYYWVDFFGPDNGVAGGRNTLLWTTDGGVTWQQSNTTPVTLTGSAQRGLTGGASLAYAFGEGLWETLNAGATWQRVCDPPSFIQVETLYNGPAVAVGSDAIWRRD